MDKSLEQQLFQCLDRDQLARLVEAHLSEAFRATRTRVFYLDELPEEQPTANPVWDFLRTRECPVHQAQLVDNATWRRYCPRADHGHVLVGPLVCRGVLVGAMAVTRYQEQGEFAALDLQRMTRWSLHVACRLAELDRPRPQLPQLTPRENQVAAQVASGLTNAQIGQQLQVTEQTVKQFLKAIFRKLGLRSRTQLAALVTSQNRR